VSERIVVAGNLSLDDTVTPTATMPDAPGGDGLYAALGVRAWGGRPELLTLVGDDYPERHRAAMLAAGIDVAHVRAVDGPTVHYRVTYREDGDRTFEWLGAEERLLLTSPAESDYVVLAGADWLHLAAMPIEAQEVGVAAARDGRVPLSLDPHEEYVVGFEDRLRRMVEGVVFLPSELEARLLFPQLETLDPLRFALAAAELLDDWGPAVVVIKLGALGSLVRLRRESVHIPAPPTPVVDPTGAGDAYCGGFVVGWLLTRHPVVAAACGTVAAGETIGRFGAFGEGPPPTIAERLARLDAVLDEARSRLRPETEMAARLTDAVDTLRRHLLSEGMASLA
jgi:ribokinase